MGEVGLNEKDLHCIARVMQGMVYMDGDMFHCCKYCKYHVGCVAAFLKTRKPYFVSTVRPKLQDVTGVYLGIHAHNIEEKLLEVSSVNETSGRDITGESEVKMSC